MAVQIIAAMAFGAVLAFAGLGLLFRRQQAARSRIKILGQEFDISTPGLIVVLVGAAIFVSPFFLFRTNDILGRLISVGNSVPSKEKAKFSDTNTHSDNGRSNSAGGQQKPPPIEEQEPNDQFSTADLIRLNQRVQGYVSGRQQDYYKVEIPDGINNDLIVKLENLPGSSLAPSLSAFNELKQRIDVENTMDRGADMQMTLPGGQKTTIYIRVGAYSGFGQGQYIISISPK